MRAKLSDARFRWFVAAYAGVAAGLLPWLPICLEQRRRIAGEWIRGAFSLSDVPAMCFEMFFHPHAYGRIGSYAPIIAVMCGLALVAAVWRGRAGGWLVACMAAVPLGLVTLVSCVASNIMVARYVSFIQPFFLIALAVGLSRIPVSWLRDVIAWLFVSAGLLVQVDFVESLDISNHPGASAAAAYIDSHRAAGEPVISCSPMVMYPTMFYSARQEGWFLYSNRPEIPYYAGGNTIVTEKEIMFDKEMDAVRAKRAWIVTSSGGWARWGLYIPPSWKKTAEERFPEIYAFQDDVKVICYEIPE
jgi:hypothetical protein